MASAIQEARTLIKDIKAANVAPTDKARLLYVNKLNQRKIQNREAAWLLRNPDFGLSPLVSEMQQSPVIGKGTYRMLKAGPIATRHVKPFTAKELRDLVSPDLAYRMDAKQYIIDEMIDSERRINDTMEFIAHCAIGRGSVRYILNDAIGRMDVNLTFPVKTQDAAATWSNIATDIVSQMDDTYIKAFINRAGKRPDTIRMTSTTWAYVKANTAVKAVFGSYIRTQGVKVSEIPVGMITPELVAKALDWPPIAIYDERTQVKYAVTNTETAASNVVVELTGGTWGISVGDKALCDYKVADAGYDDWDFEATVTAVNPGVSITITLTGTINAGEYIAVKPTFFPEQKIVLIADEFIDNEFILVPFGIEYSGSEIAANMWYGPRMDIFNIGQEPGMGVARRNWHEFGMMLGNPNKIMSVQIIV